MKKAPAARRAPFRLRAARSALAVERHRRLAAEVRHGVVDHDDALEAALAAVEIQRRRAGAGAHEVADRQLLLLAVAEMNFDRLELHRIARDAEAQRAEASFALEIEAVAVG